MANAVPKEAIASSTKRRAAPKELHHIEIHPRLGGGHTIQHHFTSYEHQPEYHHFEEGEGAAAMAHIAKHAGLPHEQVDEQEESEPEPWYEHETRKKE